MWKGTPQTYTVRLYQRHSVCNFIDHASYVENLLKKDQLLYKSSAGTNKELILEETISNKKSMDIGDRVVALNGKIPTYGVIKRIFSKDRHRHAEVAFVSTLFLHLRRVTIMFWDNTKPFALGKKLHIR